jgi:hypothetical protein
LIPARNFRVAKLVANGVVSWMSGCVGQFTTSRCYHPIKGIITYGEKSLIYIICTAIIPNFLYTYSEFRKQPQSAANQMSISATAGRPEQVTALPYSKLTAVRFVGSFGMSLKTRILTDT